jgi:ACS family hexuronate transporter-like MFS transporter
VLRWRIALLVCVAIAISYLDRQTLPVAIQAIGKDIPLSNQQFSYLQSAFLVSYAFLYAGGGKFADALGTRRGFTWIMVFWSIACLSHGLATSFAMLAVSRFLLGMGEGGGFPAATRVVAEWFPVEERATAMGMINAGTAVGAVAAPPMIALILAYTNWRWIFFFAGAIGLLWTIWWRLAYFTPQQHPGLSGAERNALLSAMPSSLPSPALPWVRLLGVRETWGLVSAKFLSDAAWYFYLFWLPKYLYDARGFDIKAVGTLAWIPYAAAGVGSLAGGGFSSWMVERRFSVDRARKVALGISAAVMPFILLVPHVRVSWALAIFSLAYCGQQSWSALVMVLPTDMFPSSVVGAVAGIVGFGGAMGGIVFGQIAGYLLDHGFGYGVVFTLAGTLHVIAFAVILVSIRHIQPLALAPRLAYGSALSL